MSLPEILAFAPSHSPSLDVPRARLGYGAAAVAAARPLLAGNPSLTLGLGPRFAAGAVGFDLDVSLEQPFELAGERRLRLEAARRRAVLLDRELDAAGLMLRQQVRAAFFQALVARERAAAAAEALSFAERIVDSARKRFDAGDISALVVSVAEGELAQARQAKLEAEGVYLLARMRLGEVAGWPAGPPPVPAGALDAPRSPPPLERLLRDAREDHPLLRVLEARVEGAGAGLALANREAWPEPLLGLGYGRESEPGGTGPTGAHIAVLTIGVALPLWRRNDAERAVARTDVAVARAELDATRRLVEARVTRSTRAVALGAERAAAWGTEILPTFAKNLELLRRSFELGEIDILQVLVVQERFLALQRAALDAHAAYYAAVATLEAELGGEVWRDADGAPHAAP